MAENIIQIKSLPGIKRDGTRFEAQAEAQINPTVVTPPIPWKA